MKCEECSNEENLVICIECDEILCAFCDSTIHKGGKRKSHSRPLVCSYCRTPAILKCKSCNSSCCLSCKSLHKNHIKTRISLPKTIGVFYDISSFINFPKPKISEIINEITIRYNKPKFFKVYCDNWNEFEINKENEIEIIKRYGIAPIDALILDASVLLNSALTHILIIVNSLEGIQHKLLHLVNNNTEILVALKVLPLVFVAFNEGIDWKSKANKLKIMGESFFRCKGLKTVKKIVGFMIEEAEHGKIMIEKQENIEKIAFLTRCTTEQCITAIDLAVKKKIINEFSMDFNGKLFVFISLHITEISEKVIEWVLKSLNVDELTSNLKNIQTRFKQIFSLDLTKKELRKFSKKIISKSLSDFPMLRVKKKSENLYFPSNGEWIGYESVKFDKFEMKNSEFYDDFLLFFERYFLMYYKQGIVKGRYGCALLVKLIGPESLKYLTVGKLIYLTNLAISDDLLRYHHRKLVWSKDLKLSNNLNFEKLEKIKKSILQILSFHPEGVYLSQIPVLFEKNTSEKLIFQNFGYKNLKEFLSSLIELELTPSHKARIKQKPVINKEKIVEMISEIIKEKEFGVTESVLQATLQARMNFSIDWSMYDVNSCEDFVKKFSQDSVEILHTPECNILFKSNELKTYSFFFPFKGSFHSAVLESSQVPTPPVYHPISYSIDFDRASKRNSYVPMQRIINVSNIPSEMAQKSPFRELDIDEEGFFTDDLSNFIGKARNCKSISEKEETFTEYHFRANSLHVPEFVQHSRINFSWADHKPLGLDENFPNI